MQSQFWKFSTAGNTTVFVSKRDALPGALAIIQAEQAGYADGMALEMAGGELCINAALAFAALLNLQGQRVPRIHICGNIVRINADGQLPEWQCHIELPVCRCESRDYGGIRVQHLNGISHALIESDDFPSSDDAFAKAAELRRDLGLEERAAAGVVWWRRLEAGLEIMPVVAVPAASTCNAEAACGSGSVALALSLGPGRHEILQPSGEKLTVQACDGAVAVEARVRLLAQGEIWL